MTELVLLPPRITNRLSVHALVICGRTRRRWRHVPVGFPRDPGGVERDDQEQDRGDDGDGGPDDQPDRLGFHVTLRLREPPENEAAGLLVALRSHKYAQDVPSTRNSHTKRIIKKNQTNK